MTTIFDETDIEAAGFQPINSSTGETVPLSMQQLLLAGRILPVGARLLVRHTFATSSKTPVEAVYSFVLPRDAALRRFRVSGPGFSARSELRPVKEAVEVYEEGIDQGHLATIAQLFRDGVVNLSVGNLRAGEPVTVQLEILAGVDLRDDGLRFRFPFTIAPSYHSQARAIAIDESACELELPRQEFGDVLLPQFRNCADGLHEVGFDLTVDTPGSDLEIASPSHTIRVGMKDGAGRVSSSAAADVPNRDLVLDVSSGKPARRIFAGQGTDNRTQFAVTVPSPEFGKPVNVARAVAFVMDRSGSMSGEPIAQARRALLACLATLSERDTFGIVAFDDQLETFRKELVPATRKNRQQAEAWLKQVDARGGTELDYAINHAARLASGPGADLFVLTDGQVWGSGTMLEAARNCGARLHTLGIGSASQDRFLTLLSRETEGVSRFVTPRERVDIAALDWFASVSAPVASKVTAEPPDGVRLEPAPPEYVYTGRPLLLLGSVDAQSATVPLKWNSGELSIEIESAADCDGETLRLLRGSRLLTDAESHISAPRSASGHRRHERELRRVEKLSREYGLASSEMALVAVVERAGDKAGVIPDTQVIPVGMPEGMTAGGPSDLHDFLIAGTTQMAQTSIFEPAASPPRSARIGLSATVGRVQESLSQILFHRRTAQTAPVPADDLLELAARLEPDGGMPGISSPDRILASLLAVLAFMAEGSTSSSGPFRAHVKKLLQFIDDELPGGLDTEQEDTARNIVRAAGKGKVLSGNWSDRVRSASHSTGAETASTWEALRHAIAGSG
jgi:Ca-activated chloride channel homolog